MLNAVLKWITDTIITPIAFAFFSVGWVIFVALPFSAAEIIQDISNFFGFSLVRQLFFGKADLSSGQIPPLPWMFVIVLTFSIFVSIFLLIYGIFKGSLSLTPDGKSKLRPVIGNAIKSVLILLAIPILYAASIILLEVSYEMVSRIFVQDNGLSELQNVFIALKPKNISANEWNNLVASHLWDVGAIYSSYKEFNFGDGALTVLMFGSISIVILLAVLKITIEVGVKSILIYFNMLIAPAPLLYSLKDEGKAFKTFTRQTMLNIGAIFALQFLFKFMLLYFIAISQIDLSTSINIGNSPFIQTVVNFILKMCLLTAGIYGIYNLMKKIDSMAGSAVSSMVSGAKLAAGVATGNPAAISSSLNEMKANSQQGQAATADLKSQNEQLSTPTYTNYTKEFKDKNSNNNSLPKRKS